MPMSIDVTTIDEVRKQLDDLEQVQGVLPDAPVLIASLGLCVPITAESHHRTCRGRQPYS